MRLKALYEHKQKLCSFISCSSTCQMHQNKHAGSLSNQQPAGLMQCTSQQTHSSVWVFFTVPKALVVSGDSTSSAGFSSGTSGLGYLHATTSFQRQNSNQSLFKIFQSILEHLPARKRSFINIKYIYNKYINMDFCGFYTNSTQLFAGFSLQKRKTKFLHLSRLEPALSNMSR